MNSETKQTPEMPFKGIRVYFSGSIGGINETDYEFPEKLTAYMQENGAVILDPQVAISSKEKPREFLEAMLGVHGLSIEQWNTLTPQEKDARIYEKDISLVNEASHVIALLNGVSFGMGMELQRALDKPKLGMNPTPILGLVHKDNYSQLSKMVRGAAQKYPNFHLQTYRSSADAKQAVFTFLSLKPTATKRR